MNNPDETQSTTDPKLPSPTQEAPVEQTATQEAPAETHPELAVQPFADKVEALMNEAHTQSQTANAQEPTAHHQKFRHWAGYLSDLWNAVKEHAESVGK